MHHDDHGGRHGAGITGTDRGRKRRWSLIALMHGSEFGHRRQPGVGSERTHRMDRGRFDGLARLVSANMKQSRRRALAVILGAVALGQSPVVPPASGKTRRKRKARAKARATAEPCFPGTGCILGPGRDNAGCDFSHSTTLVGKNVSGSDLRGANFIGANAFGANFQGADLGDSCFVDANLLNAKLDGADTSDAIFCRTVMPDGTINESGCNKGTACCPTEAPPPQDGTCRGLFNLCGIIAGDCCEGLTCTTTFAIVVTACQKVCETDDDCRPYSTNLKCASDVLVCPSSLGKCCVPR